MPMDRSRYPRDWDQISARLRTEAGCCEVCGVRPEIIMRNPANPADYVYVNANGELQLPDGTDIRWDDLPSSYADALPRRVILTVHHVGVPYPDGSPGNPDDKMDCRRENLLVLCQRCHLIADMPTHIRNRRATLARKRERLYLRRLI